MDCTGTCAGIAEGMGTIEPPPAEYDTIEEKIQYYLSQLGFDIGEDANGDPLIDGDWGNNSIAATLVFQNSVGDIPITGIADQATLNKLIAEANLGHTYDDIFEEFDPDEHPPVIAGTNGHFTQAQLDTLIVVKSKYADIEGNKNALLPEPSALAWAYVYNEVASTTSLNKEEFYPFSTVGGYRSYKDQIRLYAGYYLEDIKGYLGTDDYNPAARPNFNLVASVSLRVIM